MNKISKKLALAIQQELVKFDGTQADFIKAVQEAANDPKATKTTVDLANQFLILGTYFHKLAGQPLSDKPNYGTAFEIALAGTLVAVEIFDDMIHANSNGSIEFSAVSNKAAHIIKKWSARIALLQRHEQRRHKEAFKELGKLLPKKVKSKKAFNAAKGQVLKLKPSGAAPVVDAENEDC